MPGTPRKQFSTMIVLNEEHSEILLILREDFRIWGLPGGMIEAGETPEEAAVRETKEETGFETEVTRFCGTQTRPRMKDIRYIYQGRITGGEVLQAGPETLAVRWYKVSDLPGKCTPFMKNIIQDALNEADQPFEKVQDVPLQLVILLRLMVWLRDLRNRLTGRA